MIDWNTVKQKITDQVVSLSDLPATSVRWVDEPNGGLVNGVFPIVWLRISSIVSVGCEEERYQDSTNVDDDLDVNMTGQRQFTLSIRCESFTADIADPRHACNIIEKVKIRFWRTSSREQRNGSFTIANYLGTKWFNYIEAGKPIYTYVCDMLCNTVDNDIDTAQGSGDWIKEALISGPVKETDGSTIETIDIDAK